MSEEKVKTEKEKIAQNAKLTKDELLNALKSDFATSVNKIFINSLGEERAFREITVKEQKTLTRIMSANENRPDMIYDTQCALINAAALDPNFDIYKLSDFDRIKLLIALYQANMFQNQIKFTCEECGAENVYTLNFENALKKLDAFDLKPQEFKYENKNFSYLFVVEYPTVATVSEFHKEYIKAHNRKSLRAQKTDTLTDETMQNIEYINLFIKTIEFTNKSNGKLVKIDTSDYKVGDLEEIMSIFPQDVLYSDNGIIKSIVNNLIKPTNDAFDKHECYNCHTIHEKGSTGQAERFL